MYPKVGVALSGGGASALAEIGVLEELERAGIEIAAVAGTSNGATVGAAFAAGNLGAFRDAVSSLSIARVFRLLHPTWPRFALLESRASMEFLRPFVGENIEDLSIPFAAVAADLLSGDEVVIRSGSVLDALRASTAIPGFFSPCDLGGRCLVDGGLVNPLPIDVPETLGAKFVIAVNVLPLGHSRRERQLTEVATESAAELKATPKELRLLAVISRASKIVQAQLARERLRERPPDFLIDVPVDDVGTFDFHRGAAAVAAGRKAAATALPRLEKALRRPVQNRLRRRAGRWVRELARHDVPILRGLLDRIANGGVVRSGAVAAAIGSAARGPA